MARDCVFLPSWVLMQPMDERGQQSPIRDRDVKSRSLVYTNKGAWNTGKVPCLGEGQNGQSGPVVRTRVPVSLRDLQAERQNSCCELPGGLKIVVSHGGWDGWSSLGGNIKLHPHAHDK